MPLRFAGLLTALSALLAGAPGARAQGLEAPVAALPAGTMAWLSRHGPADAPLPRNTLELDTRQPGPRLGREEGVDPAWLRLRYVHWTPVGGAGAFGLSVGMANAPGPAFTRLDPSLPLDARNPAAIPELGLRWRSTVAADRHLDIDAWSSYDAQATPPRSYNARVELRFGELGHPGLRFSRGALGLQMSANSQMLLRAHSGGPMLYYRNRF